MQRKIPFVFLVWALAAGVLLPRAAQADAPDIRDIKPFFFLLVDTSGSMVKKGTCVCTTAECTECLPTCGGAASERDRWSTVLEALNGSWSSYECTTEDRTDVSYATETDYRYFLPYNRPPDGAAANGDGILDTYIDRVKFGLMTFDGVGTLTTSDALVAEATFTGAGFLASSTGAEGQYSYGDRKSFFLPGCATEYMMDNGARSESATSGELISVGAEGSDYRTINADIQTALYAVRPYGPTPIAGMLDDFRYYLDNDDDVKSGGDPYASCRPRYALLLTDGYPNADMRETLYGCDQPGGTCPYDRPEEVVADLCRYTGSECVGDLAGLYVVGFDVEDDPDTISYLNDLAATGGTTQAYFADDTATLITQLSAAINSAAAGTTTRTVPVFASATAGGGNAQYQFSTGFNVDDAGGPWDGVLERTRFVCNDDLEPEEQDIEDQDRFQVQLDDRNLASNPRYLFTALPSSANDLDNFITSDDTNGNARFASTTSLLTTAMLDVATAADRTAVIDWVTGSSRTARLGDIYHSSPVVQTPPNVSLSDESFNTYRITDDAANRPTMVFVGSNDGILHAFAAEDYTFTAGDHEGETVSAGEELWGFIPPILLQRLEGASTSHQVMADGTPVVKWVYTQKVPGEDAATVAERWKSILITGLRGGEKAFVALDITDPLAEASADSGPQFMWQFTASHLGYTYGRAAITQVLVDFHGTVQERAAAVLPGGTGEIDAAAAAAHPTGCSWNGAGAPAIATGTSSVRSAGHCWDDNEGRQLWILDIATGEVLKHIDESTFNAPLSGSVSAFLGDTATISTAVYATDHDGVIWRVDLSSTDPDDWNALPIYDMFYDETDGTTGQPAFEPPVLTTDTSGHVVIIQATGDLDDLEGTAANRVASLTETLTRNAAGHVTGVSVSLNWEIKLDAGEQVTGPLELFDGRLFFGTFLSQAAADACQYGESKIWGVHYLDESDPADRVADPALEESVGSGTYVSYLGPYENQIVMGVGVTQRPNCVEDVTGADPYFGYGAGTRSQVSETGGGDYQLVALVSGGSVTSTGSVATITRSIAAPESRTRVQSFAGAVDDQ